MIDINKLTNLIHTRIKQFNINKKKLSKTNLPSVGTNGGSSLHEVIKYVIYEYGMQHSLIAFPEYQGIPGKKGKRLDIVLFNKEMVPVLAVEVDRLINPRSIDKLNQMPCTKVIVSFGGRTPKEAKHYNNLGSIINIDLSKSFLYSKAA
jgi:hypothetical protein